MSHSSSTGSIHQYVNESPESSAVSQLASSTYPAIFIPYLSPGVAYDAANSSNAGDNQSYGSSIMSHAPAFSNDATYQDSFYSNAFRNCAATTMAGLSTPAQTVFPSSTRSSSRAPAPASGAEPNNPLIRRLYGVSQSGFEDNYIYPAGDPCAHEGTFVPTSLTSAHSATSYWDDSTHVQPYHPPFDSDGARLHGPAMSRGQRGRKGQTYPSLDTVANAAGAARRSQKRSREETSELAGPPSSSMNVWALTPPVTPPKKTKSSQKKLGGRKSHK
ncbi:hypothetical protein CONPUDRAFT_154271 [Coniophora puteana RWD-64-598 SS2]|uniref:Uncharacterized protein n=1 Tax=Coniophora puteana (strain RWD-64-598) TaxID=741705 RepID=A0A5M3MN74_CONPW|nr:uncharacterized protein CONPUDRAFT_154271 [Coniophora puteana RWD-64-598 SS2]EIW80224.1 hypothetical protein CONPUDRAFT_154271 [Coniophora puteana RWD-64-598 SS2]